MTLYKLTAGTGNRSFPFRRVRAVDSATGDHTPGVWMGSGLAGLGRPISRDADDPWVRKYWRVEPGSTVTDDQMHALFGKGLHPNAEQITRHLIDMGAGKAAGDHACRLGRAWRAVAGFDLTFTPVKSVSTLWALAPGVISRAIEECHQQAIADTLAFLEEHAAFSRTGNGGRTQVKSAGLIAAAFNRRDSRAGDPNLHTHLFISNKVQIIGDDGIPRWHALDAGPLYHAHVTASELYNTRIEALLIAALGVRFVARKTARDKRIVREIGNIPDELNKAFSSRRAAIEDRAGQLTEKFSTDYGREPTAVQTLALDQQATLETRQNRGKCCSWDRRRRTWRARAIEVLGSQDAVSGMIASALDRAPHSHADITEEFVDIQAAAVIAVVSQSRDTWTVNHVHAEAQRILRYADHPGGPELVDRIIAAALDKHSITLSSRGGGAENEKATALRRRDGLTECFQMR